jgi:hypothetical protein
MKRREADLLLHFGSAALVAIGGWWFVFGLR